MRLNEKKQNWSMQFINSSIRPRSGLLACPIAAVVKEHEALENINTWSAINTNDYLQACLSFFLLDTRLTGSLDTMKVSRWKQNVFKILKILILKNFYFHLVGYCNHCSLTFQW